MAAYISDSKNILQKNMKKNFITKKYQGLNLVEKLCVRGIVLQVIPSYQELGEVPSSVRMWHFAPMEVRTWVPSKQERYLFTVT